VYLYNIDDLAGIASENRALREAAAKEAELVIEYGLLQFERWRTKLASRPEIVDLRAKVEAICAAEVARHLGRAANGVDLEVEKLSHAISQKLAHELTTLVERQAEAHGDEDGRPPFLVLPRR
jgi:glutamyl-tRNA reductase